MKFISSFRHRKIFFDVQGSVSVKFFAYSFFIITMLVIVLFYANQKIIQLRTQLAAEQAALAAASSLAGIMEGSPCDLAGNISLEYGQNIFMCKLVDDQVLIKTEGLSPFNISSVACSGIISEDNDCKIPVE